MMVVLSIVVLGLVWVGVMRGYAPWVLIRALLTQFRFANLMFVALIGISVAMGIGLIAQERGLREAGARAADGFDLVVGAPGSEMTLMLAAVYLQPSRVNLLDGARFIEIAQDPRVALAAPLAFGDSFDGAPIIGTLSEFVTHLAGEQITGRLFATSSEAVVGALSALHVGDTFTPSHGHAGDSDARHDGFDIKVVGQMPPTGTPWDRAIIVPVETVWEVHGLANGHKPEHGARIGAPFDADYFPGTPAVVVVPRGMGASYQLRTQWNRADDMMAVFPGALQADLYRMMGDARQVISILTTVTQAIVAASVLLGLLILSGLVQRQLAMLKALGAPLRFVLSVVWGHMAVLLLGGAALGLVLGYGCAMILSTVITARTGVLVTPSLGLAELQWAVGFVMLSTVAALLPAWAIARRSVIAGLRGG
ncbi:ABC transporter permease [Sagittula sp. SSi028]|uniref:ABC transporter permease n=1 Tax=Sagittula sp. SSi028 TaxID=3400636 RepID=UPI003AF5E86E